MTSQVQRTPRDQARRLLSTLSKNGAARYARERESHFFGIGNDVRALYWQRVGDELQRIIDRDDRRDHGHTHDLDDIGRCRACGEYVRS